IASLGNSILDRLRVRLRRALGAVGIQARVPFDKMRIGALEETKEMIARTALEVKDVGADERGAMIGDGSKRRVDAVTRGGDPWHQRRHQHTGAYTPPGE